MKVKGKFHPLINFGQCRQCGKGQHCGCKNESVMAAWRLFPAELDIHPERCVGCMQCIAQCIAPIKAIQIVRLDYFPDIGKKEIG